MKTLKEQIPNYLTNNVFFEYIPQYGNITKKEMTITYFSRSGNKYTTDIFNEFVNEETQDYEGLANLLKALFKEKWDRIYEAITAEYNVLDNYNRIKTIENVIAQKVNENVKNAFENREQKGEQTENYTKGQETTTSNFGAGEKSYVNATKIENQNLGAEIIRKEESERHNIQGLETKETTNGAMQDTTSTLKAAINNPDLKETEKTNTNTSSQTITETTQPRTDTIGSFDETTTVSERFNKFTHEGYTDKETTKEKTDTITISEKTDTSTKNAYTDTYSFGEQRETNTENARTDIINEKERGNIGVTTSQQMIKAEINLRDYNFYNTIYSDIDSIICLYTKNTLTL